MENISVFIQLAFILATCYSVFIFYKATGSSRIVLGILSLWLLLEGLIARTGFYTVTDTIPPRFILLVAPPFAGIAMCLVTAKGRNFIDNIDVKTLQLIHIVRIAVEMIFIYFFLHKVIPEVMTFEGRNLDILSGITAPLIYYFGYVQKILSKPVMLLWNFICMGFLINIVSIAILSAPFRFQQFGFDQPNIAILYAPYVWLPCCLVPMVFFTHLVSIRQLLWK